MARDAISILDADLDGVELSGTTINASNGAYIDTGGNDQRLLVVVNNTGTAGTVTLPAGSNPPAFRAGLGSNAIAVGASKLHCFLVESARHVQSTGYVHLDFSAGGLAGTVYALRLNKEE